MTDSRIEQISPVVISHTQKIPGTEFYKMWNIGSVSNYKAQVPIFNVYNMHGLNAIIGYVMLKNSTVGKVLYRGQTRLYCGNDNSYTDLLPSICHLSPNVDETVKEAKARWNIEINSKIEELDKLIGAIIDDKHFLKQIKYNFNTTHKNHLIEMQNVIEALIQHYGGSTRCMDFVDNHWIALWFGLYQWVSDKNKPGQPVECFYRKRILKHSRKNRQDYQETARREFYKELKKCIGDAPISQAKNEFNKLLKDYSHKLAFAEDQFLYILLFVANTLPEHGAEQHAGVYLSRQMTVVDLRRALPSTFLRPGSQHGWTVKMNSPKEFMNRGDYSFAKNIVAILRIPLCVADELIGGALLSQENLFPPEDYDQGYRILLQHQDLAVKKKDDLTELDKAFQCMPISKYK